MKPDPYSVVCPVGNSLESLESTDLLDQFSEETVSFVSELSTALMRDPRTASMAEVTAMAYWLRKANIKRMQKEFEEDAKGFRLPRGTVFHIAPSNVDTIFVYSLFLSIFCGNRNIVRLSSTPNLQVDSILAVMNETLAGHPRIANSMLIVRYDHSEATNTYFSSLCDVRMIWGGDETIRRIRGIPLPPRAKELTFADRFSLAMINADYYLNSEPAQVSACIEGFYNDSFWFNQMACSSPRLVCWLGTNKEKVESAQIAFWQQLQKHMLRKNHEIAPAAIMDKLVAQCSLAVEATGSISIESTQNRAISRVFTTEVQNEFREIHCGNGLFLEMSICTLDELLPSIDQKVQTITSYGVSGQEIARWLLKAKPKGIDRVVPFGSALNFSSHWDGYRLLDELCRNVDISQLP